MIYLILGLGLVLRLISLNQSLWLDEATTALVTKMSLGDIFTKFLPGDFHPPLYYLIMKYWVVVFGNAEISLRIPSIIFGLGTIYFTYIIGKKIFDKKTGLLAAILLATSGLSIYYSQEARMYALAAFLVSAAIYFFLERKWIFLFTTLMLIGMTDYVALFVVPVLFVVGSKSWKKISFSLIPLVMSFALWSPIFIKQISSGVSVKGTGWWNILGLPTFKNIALIPVKFMFGRIGFDNKTLYVIIVAAATCLFGFLLVKSLKASKILWSWLLLPIIIGIIVSFKVPTLIYFRYLFCLTPFYLLLAYGLGKIGKLRNLFIILLIVFNLVTSGYYLFDSKFHREDWRGLVAFIESSKTADSITIFPSASNMEAYYYYASDAKIAGPEEIKAGYNQVWLMEYLSDVFDPSGAAKSKIEALGYKLAASYTFGGVGEVNLYKK